MRKLSTACAAGLLVAGCEAWAAISGSLPLTSPGGCTTAIYTDSQITYTYQVQNKSGSNLSRGDLTVTVSLDPKLVYGGYSGSNWSCTASASTVSCTYYRNKLPKNKYTSQLLVSAYTPGTATTVTTGATAAANGITSSTLSCVTAVTVPVPSNFDAVDASGNCSGKAINTHVVNQSFSLGINAVTTPTFNGTVAVYLLDASSFGSPPYSGGTNNCPKTLALDTTNRPKAYIYTGTTAMAAGKGTFTVPASIGSVYQNVLVFMIDTSNKTNYACSTDNFAIRPDHFNLTPQDADWRTAGTTRSLSNTAASGGIVHASGRPFRLAVQAVDASNNALASYTNLGIGYFYDSTNANALRPDLLASAVLQPGTGGTAGNLDGSFTSIPSGGTVVATDVSYDEAGAVTLLAYDDDFATVDARNTCSTQSDRRIGGTTNLGRFIPDALTVTGQTTPQLKTFNADNTTCPSRSFTYVGQPFGFATLPAFTVKAWSYDDTAPQSLDNYRGSSRLSSSSGTTQVTSAYSSTSATLDTSATGLPSVTDNSGGVMGATLVSANAGDTLSFSRSATALAPFSAAIRLDIPIMDCADQGGTGTNACIPICLDAGNTYGNSASSCTSPTTYTVSFNGSGSGMAFDAGNAFRYGYLSMPATASVPNTTTNLTLGLETKYWNGTAWATNTLDNCTSVAANTFTLSGYTQNLSQCATLLSMSGKITAGTASATLSAPGGSNKGSVMVSPNLGATATGNTAVTPCSASSPTAASAASLPWLQCSTSYLSNCSGSNPKTTATFNGTTPAANKTRHIYMREVF